MSNSEFKKMLVNKINLIEDEAYLLAINTLIDNCLNGNVIFKLNDKQWNKINDSMNQVLEGNTIDIDSAFDDINRWLNIN
ncbi:MAG: hypothetical protein ACOVO9_01565 [Bacteroidia bacterium]